MTLSPSKFLLALIEVVKCHMQELHLQVKAPIYIFCGTDDVQHPSLAYITPPNRICTTHDSEQVELIGFVLPRGVHMVFASSINSVG